MGQLSGGRVGISGGSRCSFNKRSRDAVNVRPAFHSARGVLFSGIFGGLQDPDRDGGRLDVSTVFKALTRFHAFDHDGKVILDPDWTSNSLWRRWAGDDGEFEGDGRRWVIHSVLIAFVVGSLKCPRGQNLKFRFMLTCCERN